ncbi:MAG: redoxin domain-containing protein [Chloroflexi bacterium]|nr:redoxin domain-containing protein [Chloroflexota bacterium]
MELLPKIPTLKRRWLVWLIPLFAFLIVAFFLLQPATQPAFFPVSLGTPGIIRSGSIAEGAPAPDFTLDTLDGGQVTLSDLRGQAVVINFWTSWCGPCRIETPLLVETYNKYREQGLVILGLNITKLDNLDDVKAFVEEFTVLYPIPLDKTGEVSQDYQVLGLPTTFFVDRQGIIRKIYTGLLNESLIDDFLSLVL